MAVGVGFEPTVPLRVHLLSRQARSATPAPHLIKVYKKVILYFYYKQIKTIKKLPASVLMIGPQNP